MTAIEALSAIVRATMQEPYVRAMLFVGLGLLLFPALSQLSACRRQRLILRSYLVAALLAAAMLAVCVSAVARWHRLLDVFPKWFTLIQFGLLATTAIWTLVVVTRFREWRWRPLTLGVGTLLIQLSFAVGYLVVVVNDL